MIPAPAMADADFKGASPNSQFLVGELPHGESAQARWWEGTGASIAAHVLLLGVLIYTATHTNQVINTVTAANEKLNFIFLPQKGPGGGGGGRPKDPEPPRKAEIVATKPVQAATPIPKPANVPTPEVVVPLQTVNAVQTLPGSISGLDVPNATGSGGGGTGTGIGTGRGSGVGEGYGGGFGGGAYQIGNGVSSPVLLKEVKPNYTGDAMRAKLQGVVEMECIVLPDGTVDPKSIKITRSLDANFGLDQQAIIAVKQWRFRPGTFKGQPVPVVVNVELTFTLR
jgi:protein TonB